MMKRWLDPKHMPIWWFLVSAALIGFGTCLLLKGI